MIDTGNSGSCVPINDVRRGPNVIAVSHESKQSLKLQVPPEGAWEGSRNGTFRVGFRLHYEGGCAPCCCPSRKNPSLRHAERPSRMNPLLGTFLFIYIPVKIIWRHYGSTLRGALLGETIWGGSVWWCVQQAVADSWVVPSYCIFGS